MKLSNFGDFYILLERYQRGEFHYFFWQLRSRNHWVLASSPDYQTRARCLSALRKVAKEFPQATVVDFSRPEFPPTYIPPTEQ